MEYDELNRLANSQTDMPEESEPPKPRYVKAFFAGLGTSIVVGAALALVGMWLEAEYVLALLIGGLVVGGAIRAFVPSHTVGGGIIGMIMCPLTYFFYQIIMALNGYAYEKDGEETFYILLLVSAAYGFYAGYGKWEREE